MQNVITRHRGMAERTGRALRAAWLIAALAAFAATAAATAAWADDLIDKATVAEVLRKPDGLVVHLETEYNDIFITKSGSQLTMSFRRFRADYLESTSDLREPDNLPIPYTQMMTVGLVYPGNTKRLLMIGLGGGSTTTYLARYLADTAIDTVELDPGVITATRKYFGLLPSERIRFIPSDGRVFLVRNKEPYDIIMLDAFRGGYVPFHLLTREFYAIVKERLTPDGVAVFNLHGGTKLYASTLTTLRAVFPSIDLYTLGGGNIIAVASKDKKPDDPALMQRAAALQAKYNFRYSMVRLLNSRIEVAPDRAAPLLTDDFAPVQLFDAIRDQNKRRW